MIAAFYLRALCASAALCIVGASSGVLAEPVRVPPGFINGGTYQSSPQNVRNGYVSGMVDGLSFGIAINRGSVGNWLTPCLASSTIDQLRTTVDGFVQGHPEMARQPMSTVFYRAMMVSCASKGFSTAAKPQG